MDWEKHRSIRKVALPTAMALENGIRSLKCTEAIVNRNLADVISMSRPFIIDPNLIKKLEAGQDASTCNSCSRCISKDFFGKMMLRCHRVCEQKKGVKYPAVVLWFSFDYEGGSDNDRSMVVPKMDQSTN